jgi:Flp pilus assembly protein TadG
MSLCVSARALRRSVTTMFQRTRTTLAGLALRLRLRTVRRLVGNESGAAAVEFSFVAVPFFMLLLAIFETSIVFFAGQTLETAVSDSARKIMTGQANQFDAATFKTEVCSKIYSLFDCTKAQVDVRVFASFAAISVPKPVTNGAFDATKISYSTSNKSDVVVVRVFYKWPIYLSLYGFNLADLSDKTRLLTGTAVFKNEPF